jgi:HEPN domain-containing protein
VTNRSLAESYLTKSEKRLKALRVLKDEGAHSDVVREAQEIVELALKGALRAIGVEPGPTRTPSGSSNLHGR